MNTHLIVGALSAREAAVYAHGLTAAKWQRVDGGVLVSSSVHSSDDIAAGYAAFVPTQDDGAVPVDWSGIEVLDVLPTDMAQYPAGTPIFHVVHGVPYVSTGTGWKFELHMTDEFGNSILTTAGVEGSLRDFLQSGVYNNTFASGPLTTIDNVAAPLPFWEVVKAGAATASDVVHASNTSTGSKRQANLTLSATGALATDSVRIRQFIPLGRFYPITGTRSFRVEVRIGAPSGSAAAQWGFTGQLYEADKATTVGSLRTTGDMTPVASTAVLYVTSPASNAAYLRVEIYLKRNGTNTLTRSLPIYGVSLVASTPAVVLNQPSSSGSPAVISAPGGATSTIELDAEVGGTAAKQYDLSRPANATTSLTMGGTFNVARLYSTDIFDFGGPAKSLLGGHGRLRYVPIADTPIWNVYSGSTTAATQILTPELTVIPANVAKLVVGMIVGKTSVAGIGNVISAQNYSGLNQDEGLAGKAYMSDAGYFYNAYFTAVPGGTNGRQIRVYVVRVAGTIEYYMRITGYYTDDI